MKIQIKTICLGFLVLFISLSHSDLKIQPFRIWAVQELGMMQSGVTQNSPFEVYRDEWINRFGGYLHKEATIDEKLRLLLGFGGIFQFAKPEVANRTVNGSQSRVPRIEVNVAKGVYTWGDAGEQNFSFHFGLFPYKYNLQAYNLGEYLYRTTPYPQTINTGGNLVVNSKIYGNKNHGLHYESIGFNAASELLQGIGFNFNGGGLYVDLLLTTEVSTPPYFDMSLGAIVDYTVADGLFTIGAGGKFHRMLPIRKDITIKQSLSNAVFDINDPLVAGQPLTVTGEKSYYQKRSEFYAASTDTLNTVRNEQLVFLYDSIVTVIEGMEKDMEELATALSTPGNPVTVDDIAEEYLKSVNATVLDSRGIILMARAAFDVKKLFRTNPLLSEHDFKIFAETALLGLKNQPFYYTSQSERMPIMFGVNIPTFGLLDLFSIQCEIFKSPYINSNYHIGNLDGAIPEYLDDGFYSDVEYFDVTEDDDFYWSVLLQRKIGAPATISLQFARDHFRPNSSLWTYGQGRQPGETYFRNGDWYWAAQLSWGI